MKSDVTAWNGRLLDIYNNPLNLKSLITEIKAPSIEREFDTTKRAGEPGIIPRPKYIKEIEVSFTAMKMSSGLLRSLLEGVGDYGKTVTLQATAIIDSDTTSSSYIWTTKGCVSKAPLGNLGADGIEAEFSIMATQIDLQFGNEFSLSYDPKNYMYVINGVNIWANIKASIN
jgi:phage tail tube protein FII